MNEPTTPFIERSKKSPGFFDMPETGCSGCSTLPGGIICIVLGVFCLVRWYYGDIDTREYARGERSKIPLAFSRRGVFRWEPRISDGTPTRLNLCFCEKYGPDLTPPASVLKRLWFDVRIMDSDNSIRATFPFRGDRASEPIRGIELTNPRRDGLYMMEQPFVIEVEVLKAVDELEGIPAALYFVRYQNRQAGIPRVLNHLFLFVPGVFLLLAGVVQVTIAMRRPRHERILRETPFSCDATGPEHVSPGQSAAPDGGARQEQRLTSYLPDVITTIDRLLKKTMLGGSKLDPSLLLVARALVSEVEHPGRIWRIYKVAMEAASQSAAISRVREAFFEGKPVSSNSTFDVTEDAWVCYVAVESADERRRAVAVEILDAYAFDDCGCILDVNLLKVMPPLPDGGIRHWVLDLEDVAGISVGEGSPHGQGSGDGE